MSTMLRTGPQERHWVCQHHVAWDFKTLTAQRPYSPRFATLFDSFCFYCPLLPDFICTKVLKVKQKSMICALPHPPENITCGHSEFMILRGLRERIQIGSLNCL